MTTHARLKWPALLFVLALITACTATIAPEWVRTYNHKADVESDRLSWFDDMQVDSYGNLVIAATTIRANLESRIHDFVLVKYSPSGERLMAKDFDLSTSAYSSDDTPAALALDSQDNVYVLVQQFRREGEESSSEGTVLISFDGLGNERWRQPLGENQTMNALTVAGGKVYVTGVTTQVFTLNGQRLLNLAHPEHQARSVAVNINGDILLGGGSAIRLYNGQGQLQWAQSQADSGSAFGEAKFAMNGDLIAVNALEERGAAQVLRYNVQGQQLWSRNFSAAYQSYGLPGQPMVFEDNRGDLLMTTSNAEGHRVAKLDASGRVIWNSRSRKGIVQDAALKDGELFVVGGGQNGKYDRDGNRLGESEVGRNVQITTGSVAIDGDRLYTGYSAEQNGAFALHLSQYLDQ